MSSHEAAQLAQNAEKGKMYKYDYGDARSNMAAYGSVSPPIYNVSNIVSKSISFWRGQKDALATPTDVEILKSDFKGENYNLSLNTFSASSRYQLIRSIPPFL